MAWHAYRLVYRLKSPLHLGWRKIGNLMQTRPYATGRNWWGIATSHLTRWKGSCDYQEVGKFVQANLIFGYFFPAIDPDNPLIPRRDGDQIYYGSFSVEEFERQFLSSLASTAIDYQKNAAAEGQLHEVEFIMSRILISQTERKDVLLVGHLLAYENDRIKCNPREIHVDGLLLLTRVLTQVQIGGERRYGFGRLQLVTDQVTECNEIFGHTLKLDSEKPLVQLNTTQPLPAHFLVDGFEAEGEIEPLLGREWHADTGPGRHLSAAVICWMPGSSAQQSALAEIRSMGIWAKV